MKLLQLKKTDLTVVKQFIGARKYTKKLNKLSFPFAATLIQCKLQKC